MADRNVSRPGRLLGMLKSVNPNPSGMYNFDICHPVWPDVEGSAVAWSKEAGQTLLAAWLGADKPPADRPVILHPNGEFYVGGGAKPAIVAPPGVNLAGCSCQNIPATLYMIPNNPVLNGGMFKNCILQYVDTPAGYAKLALGPKCFLSVENFQDQIDQTYRYFFNCSSSNFMITRIYVSSIFGSPYRDSVRFTWTIGAPGNTCNPFLLTSGNIYQGGDTRSQITITPTAP